MSVVLPIARPRPGTLTALGLFVAILVVGTIVSSGFASASNLRQLVVFASFVGIAAIGQTFIIVAGGLDLSVPWVFAFGGIQLSMLTNDGMPGIAALILVVALGALIGAVNGFGVTWLKVAPIVMTLAVGGLVQAYLLAVGLLKSQGNSAPQIAQSLATSRWGQVPVAGVIWIVLAIAAAGLLQRSTVGRDIYASGASDVVAYLSGVNVRRTRLLTYVVGGAASAFAGIMLSGYLGSTYVDIGSPYLFSSIAAVVVGGASILGGSGTYWGTFFGALTLTALSAVLPLFHLSDAQLKIAYGLVILGGVWVSTAGSATVGRLRRRQRRHASD